LSQSSKVDATLAFRYVLQDQTMETAELELLQARWRLGEIRAHDLHEIADVLLTGGELTSSLIALFALPAEVASWESPALFEQALVELGAEQ
jgi:hypothetical protein